MCIEPYFNNFPKVRSPLPKAFQNIYKAQYKDNREGKTPASLLSKIVESWLHKKVASDAFSPESSNKTTLEVGAGTLNQLEYEPFINIYDIVEPFTELYEKSPALNRVRNVYRDISDIPESQRYDRITSTATLEHICNLPEVVARIGMLLSDNGTFRASIPNEGALLWKICWKITTGLEFRFKYGLDYEVLIRHEHVNTSEEISKILSYFFADVNCCVFGFTKSLSVYHFYECSQPINARCKAFLKKNHENNIQIE